MSLDISSERVCYVHCNLCNTILAVGIPYSNMYNIVTVRCGHCANLLSVNIGHLQQISLPFHDFQNFNHNFQDNGRDIYGSSSKNVRFLPLESTLDQINQPRMLPIRPPEKRQRVPSAYNKFIKEEIQRIKASNPDISHREAFSTAAKNWAHFPHIRFGLNLEAAKQRAIVDEAAFMGADAPQIKAHGRLY